MASFSVVYIVELHWEGRLTDIVAVARTHHQYTTTVITTLSLAPLPLPPPLAVVVVLLDVSAKENDRLVASSASIFKRYVRN